MVRRWSKKKQKTKKGVFRNMLVSKYGDGQEREKEVFSEYAGQMMAKDADGQEIVTKSLAK